MKKKLVWLLVLVAALLVCTVALADWEVENGTYLVYRDKGKLKTGSVKIDGVTYTFDANGHLVYTDSAVKIGGSVYYVNKDGTLATGWVQTGHEKYYFGADHRALSGWQELSDYFHYFEPNTASPLFCAMVTGPRTIEGQLCNFDADGVLLTNNRTVTINGLIYALDPENKRYNNTWREIDGSTYYFGNYYSDDGTPHVGYSAALGGCYIMNSKEHFMFGEDGKQRTGLYKAGNGTVYYYDPNSESWGASHNGCRFYSGWKYVAGNTYYFNEEGAAYTGAHTIWNGSSYDYYYFDSEGRMQTGRVEANGRIFFYNTDGRMITGWYQPAGADWYYLTTEGALTGLQMIRDDATGTFDKYYFSSEGFLQYRFVTIGGRLYYFDPAKKGRMVTGWQWPEGASGNTYYFDETNGYALTGQQSLLEPGGSGVFDYYFSSDGKMQTGLQTINGKIYYYYGGTGQRVNGWYVIDGATYYFTPYALTSTTQKLVGPDGKENYFEFDADGKVIVGKKTVISFVERCYNLLLQRESDPNGLHDWVNKLRAGQMNAAELVQNFIYSPEFIGQANTNPEKVERLYQTMLDRVSDPAGKEDWTEYLDSGCSEKSLINGFSGSFEFNELCSEYGITTGRPGSLRISLSSARP